jgi:hypothetical protein
VIVGSIDGSSVANENVGRKATVDTGAAVDVGNQVGVAGSVVTGGGAGVDRKLLQDASIPTASNKRNSALANMFILPLPLMPCKETSNDSGFFTA